MAWVNFTTPEAIGDAYGTYGTVKLQYDNSSVGSTRSCRLYFELDQGKTIYIYFRNITIDGTEVQYQTLVEGSMAIWSGTLSAGTSHSYSFNCPWYTGTAYYGSSGTLPTGYVAPTTPTISATVSGTTATITYGTTSFGIPSTGTVTLYGGTSANPTTSIDTTNTTGNKTFSHTGLTPGTTYYYRARANNGQLNSNYSTEVSITVPTSTTERLYGSVNSQTEKVNKLYGSRKMMTQLNADMSAQYAIVTDVNESLFISKYNQWAAEKGLNNRDDDELDYIYVSHRSDGTNLYEFSLYGTFNRLTGSRVISINSFNTVRSVAAQWGITITSVSAYLADRVSTTPTYQWQTKEIDKLYGSVNGQTKLIYSA